jgi:hypothetical protein
VASFQERLAIIVEANAGKAIAEFKKVGAAAKEAGAGADGGAKGMARFGIAGKTASNLLKGGIAVAAAAAATAIAKFAVDGVSAFQEVTAEIRAFQRVSGASAEEASKLVAAFHILGIDSQAAGNAVFKLAANIGTGKKAFADSGIVIARTKTGYVDLVGTILNVGDAYKSTGDQTKKTGVLVAAFGAKQGQALIPLLGKTREQLEAIFAAAGKHGLIFNQEQLEKAREYAVATRELGEALKGVKVAAGEALVPFLTDVAIAMTNVTDAAHTGGGGIVGRVIGDLLQFNPVGMSIKGISLAVHALAGDEGDLAIAAAVATAEMAEQADKVEALKKTIFSATDAERSYESAKRAVADADRGLAKATADYNKLVKEGAVDEEKVAAARRSLADATRSVADANRGVAKAQKEYNEAAAAAAILGTDSSNDVLAEAAEGLADAQDTAASASERAQDAAHDLAKAQAGDPEFQQKLADANLAVAAAKVAVEEATYNVGKRSYENVAAFAAEGAAIGANAQMVQDLREELEGLLRLNPEQFAFLAPIISALDPGPGERNPVLGTTGPGGGIFAGREIDPGPGYRSPISTGGGLLGGLAPTVSGGVVNNNVTINNAHPVDESQLARQMIWALN